MSALSRLVNSARTKAASIIAPRTLQPGGLVSLNSGGVWHDITPHVL